MVDSFEMREEIDYGGKKYFLQTSFLPQKKCIQSSFFKNGALFDSVTHKVGEKPSSGNMRELTKEIHLQNKKRLQFLFEVRDKIKAYKEPIPHMKLAQVLFRRSLFEEAIEEAIVAAGKENKNSEPYIIIGESFFQIGEYDKAIEAINRGIKINPQYPDLHNLMGRVYLKQKMCKQAIESFKRAIGFNLYYGEPYLNMARAYLLNSVVKEDYELSKDLDFKFSSNLQRASQLNPLIQGEQLEKARQLFKEDRYEETLEQLDSVAEGSKRGEIKDIVLELYLMLLGDGENLKEEDIERYLKRVEEIIDQNPTFADGYNSLGILYTAKCKILMDRAGWAFRKALDINKNYRKAQKNLRLAENDRQGIFILLKALLD